MLAPPPQRSLGFRQRHIFSTAGSGQCQCVRWSPYHPGTLAVGTGKNFGIISGGAQHILHLPESAKAIRTSRGPLELKCSHSVLDCCWSEAQSSVVAAGLVNGQISLWDVESGVTNSSTSLSIPPKTVLLQHAKEVSSTDWNIAITNLLLSASWDGSAIVWDMGTGASVSKIVRPGGRTLYSALWHPSQPHLFGTCGADGEVALYDVRAALTDPAVGAVVKPIGAFRVAPGEALSFDWNKYDQYMVATSGTDNEIRIWDIRSASTPVIEPLRGHRRAVRKVRWSPFHREVLASASYDMSVSVWDISNSTQITSINDHTEFVMGLDWSLFVDGLLASASWDMTVRIWEISGAAQ